MRRLFGMVSLLLLLSSAYGLVNSNFGWYYGRFGAGYGMNDAMTWWSASATHQRVKEVQTTVFCDSNWSGTLRVSFYRTKVLTPTGALVGGNLIGQVNVPISLSPSSVMQSVSTGNILAQGITLPNNYFGVETTFMGASNQIEIVCLTGMMGGVLDDDFYTDYTCNGTLTNNEGMLISEFYGLAPTVYVDSVLSGDCNADGKTDDFDFNLVITNFGADYRPGTGPGDCTGDGLVNDFDFNLVIINFGLGGN